MSDELKTALTVFVQQIIAAAKDGASWTAEQAPMVVQEWLRWQVVSGFTVAAVTTVMTVICLRVAWGIHRWVRDGERRPYDDRELTYIPAAVLVVAGVLAWFEAALPALMDATKALIAPRVVVLERFMELLK